MTALVIAAELLGLCSAVAAPAPGSESVKVETKTSRQLDSVGLSSTQPSNLQTPRIVGFLNFDIDTVMNTLYFIRVALLKLGCLYAILGGHMTQPIQHSIIES